MASEAQKRYEQLPWLGKLRLHLSRDYEGFALRARAEAAEAEVRALTARLDTAHDVIRQMTEGDRVDAEWDPAEYGWSPAEAAEIRAATTDPTPQTETP